jgi:hypothetical protein
MAFAFILVTLICVGAPARAQYMYLDSNGDGVHTATDLLQPNGVSTTVDLYLATNQNRDGSPRSVPIR